MPLMRVPREVSGVDSERSHQCDHANLLDLTEACSSNVMDQLRTAFVYMFSVDGTRPTRPQLESLLTSRTMSFEEIPGHLPRGRACQACRYVSSPSCFLEVAHCVPQYAKDGESGFLTWDHPLTLLLSFLSEMRWQLANM